MAGLFDTFSISRRGLNVQQGNINTTAHNISNASTPGYSRQRAVVETTRPFGGTSKYSSCSYGQIGTGAQITTIQRIRNEFVDYQVREANGILGNSAVKAEFLSKIEDIMGETSDTGIQGLMSQLYKSLQSLTSASEKTDVKGVVIQNALSLTDSLNYTYNQLQKQLDNAQTLLGTNVVEINGYLDRVNTLNKQIASATALGQSPNDLMDSRDYLLDQLSSKFGINIDKKALNTIDLNSNEYDNLKLVNSDPNDVSYNRFSTVKSATVDKDSLTLTVEYYANGDTNSNPLSFSIKGADVDSLNAMKAELEQCRVLIADQDGKVNIGATNIDAAGNFKDASGNTVNAKGIRVDANGYLVSADGSKFVDAKGIELPDQTKKVKNTEDTSLKSSIFKIYEHESGINNVTPNADKIKGEIAGNQSVQATIKGYMDELDKLAASLAYTMNAIQTGTTSSGLNESNSVSLDLIFINKDSDGAVSDDHISAKNITINKALLDDASKLNCKPANESGGGANDRAMAMAALNTIMFDYGSLTTNAGSWTRESFLDATKVGFKDTDGTAEKNIALKGSTSGSTMVVYYSGIISKLGSASKTASDTVANQDTVLQSLENQRLSESGVSLDEEMTDLVQFQHAYQANAKMISTIDQLLDVVINGLTR